MTVCLDSWAVLRWLEGVDPAAARVEEALSARPVMSASAIIVKTVIRQAAEHRARQASQRVRGDDE